MAYNPLAFGLMLVASGSLMMAAYIFRQYMTKADNKEEKGFGGIFVILAIISGIFGFNLYFQEPIPGQYIEIYAVGYLIFTMLMMIAGLCMLFQWDKRPASYMAAIGGVMLLHSSYVVFSFSLSKSPLATAGLFALSGIGSLGSVGVTHMDGVSESKMAMLIGCLIFLAIGLLALYTGLHAQSGHVASALAAAA